MPLLDFDELKQYVNENIVIFHKKKLNKISNIKLNDILKRKNPYLFKAKNINIAGDLVKDILDAYLYASEEKMFGDFLEDLAIFISAKTRGAKKSAASGIDLEFDKESIRYLVSVKSGPHWGNNSQKKRLATDFENAQKALLQSSHIGVVQPLLGICYGKAKKTYKKPYIKLEGQEFWEFISGNRELYVEIIEPLGHEAKKHNEYFSDRKKELVNVFTLEFIKSFCSKNGKIDWVKIVKFNSGNL